MTHTKSYSIREGIEPIPSCCNMKVYIISDWEKGEANVYCDICGKLLKEFKIERCYQGDESCPIQ